MSFIIVCHNPNTRKLLAVTEFDNSISEFETREEAEAAANNVWMCESFGYQVVEVD